MGTIAESKHAVELRRRGFTKLGHAPMLTEDQTQKLAEENEIHWLGKDAFFLWLGGDSETTYVMDETGTFWKCDDEFVDLSDLGFTQRHAPDLDDGRPRRLN